MVRKKREPPLVKPIDTSARGKKGQYMEVECNIVLLTHWGRDKMATISQTILFKRILLNETVKNSIKISLNVVRKGQIDNNPALVQIAALRLPGVKANIWTNNG